MMTTEDSKKIYRVPYLINDRPKNPASPFGFPFPTSDRIRHLIHGIQEEIVSEVPSRSCISLR